MPPIRIPPGVPFPAIAYDASDDSLEFDLEGVRAIVEANAGLEWTEHTLPLLLATWYLHEVAAGRQLDPMVLDALGGTAGAVVH